MASASSSIVSSPVRSTPSVQEDANVNADEPRCRASAHQQRPARQDAAALGARSSFRVSAAKQPEGPEMEERRKGEEAEQAGLPGPLDEFVCGGGRIIVCRHAAARLVPNFRVRVGPGAPDLPGALPLLPRGRETHPTPRLAE